MFVTFSLGGLRLSQASRAARRQTWRPELRALFFRAGVTSVATTGASGQDQSRPVSRKYMVIKRLMPLF